MSAISDMLPVLSGEAELKVNVPPATIALLCIGVFVAMLAALIIAKQL